MTATANSISTSTAETLAFFNAIPKCAEVLSQPDLSVVHPRNPDALFHSTLRSNNGILKSVFLYQPVRTHTDESRTSDGASAAKARGYLLLHLGRGVAGQPDIAHGGFLATVLDQVTGTLIRASKLDRGRGAVTAYLNVGYRRPVRVPGVVVAMAEVGRVDGRKIYVQGKISGMSVVGGEEEAEAEEEGVCVTGEGMFLVKRDVVI